MMNFRYPILSGIAVILLFATMVSCNESDPNIKHTNAEAFAGEWFVTYSLGGSDVGGGYSTIITSNTAANVATEFLISDYVDPNATTGNFWSYKAKANSVASSLAFSATDAPSHVVVKGDDYDITLTITNGKIFPKGGLSKSKVAVDSIYFEVEFSDDPGDKFICSGHKRTGFTEDEY